MHWIEKSEKPPFSLTKTENQRLKWRKPADWARHQNRKTAVFKCENRKTEPGNWPDPQNRKSPTAPSLTSVLTGSRTAVGEQTFPLCVFRCLPISERSLAFQLSIGIHNRETATFSLGHIRRVINYLCPSLSYDLN